MAGDGPSAPFFEAMHGKENRIYCKPRFLNHAELAEVYASSDVHVSASQFETLGNTVLEAFACGIPVVVPRTQVWAYVRTCVSVKHNTTRLRDAYYFHRFINHRPPHRQGFCDTVKDTVDGFLFQPGDVNSAKG